MICYYICIKLKENEMKKKIIIISGAITAIICLVMNIILIPKIQSCADSIPIFDMNFNYSYDTAIAFLEALSKEGRELYLNVQLPLDFVYPCAYCIFFSLLLFSLSRGKKLLIAAPVLLAISDYIENICSVIMLKASKPNASLISFASTVTVIKTLLMYGVFIMIIAFIIYYFATKKKHQSDK